MAGGNIAEDLSKQLGDIVSNPQEYKEYQRNLAIYAFNEAVKGGYKGNINQFAATTGIEPILSGGTLSPQNPPANGGNLVFDAVKFGWDKVAKPAVQKSIEADKKRKKFEESGRRKHFENSWEAVKKIGYKHNWFTFYLSLTNKPLGWKMEGGGVFDTVVGTAVDGFVNYGLPWMGKKAVEMGGYYGSEALRNPKLQKKAINYALDKLNPMIQNVGSQALDQLSTKIRPKKKYKTNRKDLDGGRIDIHKKIGKLPKPKKGWTLPGHKYTGPYNDLENQVRYDPVTGEILEIYDQPTGATDAVAMQHDVDYSVCGDDRKCKNKADRKMVKSLDAIPWKERQWGHTLARTIINTKQKLGMGTKNVKRR